MQKTHTLPIPQAFFGVWIQTMKFLEMKIYLLLLHRYVSTGCRRMKMSEIEQMLEVSHHRVKVHCKILSSKGICRLHDFIDYPEIELLDVPKEVENAY